MLLRDKFLAFFFSFETLCVLWLFSYQYKNAFALFQPFDFTLLLTLLMVPWALIVYAKNKTLHKAKILDLPSLVFLSMSGWFLLSTLWTASHNYMLEKSLCYGLYTISGFFFGYLIISQDSMRLERLCNTLFVFGVGTLGVCFYHFWHHGIASIQDILGTNYLVTGQTLGAGLVVLMARSFFPFFAKTPFTQWLGFFVGSLFIYGLLNIGGRGPLIAAIAAYLFLGGVQGYCGKTLKPFYAMGLFFFCCSLTYVVFNAVFSHTSSHFAHKLTPVLLGQGDESLQVRFQYYQTAWTAFLTHPLWGVGWGGWPLFHGLGDISLHPHNIFLEILAETGLMGFGLFVIFVLFSLKDLRFSFIAQNASYATVALLVLFSFLNALKTGDLHDNTLLFFSLALCAGLRLKA